jgi:hypothetical protein
VREFHSSEAQRINTFEDFYLVGDFGESQATFRRNISAPSSWTKIKANKKPTLSTRCMTRPQYTFDTKLVEDNNKFEMMEILIDP